MAKKDGNIINTFEKGLYMDSTPETQPKGTYNYALNSVVESEGNNLNYFSTEESNKLAIKLQGRTLVGNTYMGNNEIALLTVTSENLSEIGIFNSKTDTYESHVILDLGFTKDHQFDMTYRLRRGCERVIYFTDNNIRPMSYNFDKPDLFKSEQGFFQKERFFLQKSYNKLPMFRRIETLEGLGKLSTGAYFVAIQYLDEDLNPTEFANISSRVNIYKDKITDSYADIGGSSSLDTGYYKDQETNKSLKISLYNLDPSYRFYRLAIIKYKSDSGLASEVGFTDKISTNVVEYIYDGNDFTKGTLEEVQQENFIIDKAKNIIQLDNQLIFSNIAGRVTDYCSLQKYASKIKSRVVVKEQVLNSMTPGSPKNPNIDLFSVGYMPGEIYSFGVVYLFSDGTKSPVYHIPGITEDYLQETLPTGRYHMSTNNELQSINYDKRDSCTDYWGVDAYGKELLNKKVRHHRFPTREELGIGFVYKPNNSSSTAQNQYKSHNIDILLQAYIKNSLEDSSVPIGTQCNDEFTLTIKYTLGAEEKILTDTITVLDCNYNERLSYYLGDAVVANIIEVTVDSKAGNTITKEVTPIYTQGSYSYDSSLRLTKILGIEFTGIELPEIQGDVTIIGYEIVRQERDQKNKTILDTGVLTPVINNKNFASTAHIFPNYITPTSENINNVPKIFYDLYKFLFINTTSDLFKLLNKNYKGLISPDFLFNNNEYGSAKIRQLGSYKLLSREHFSNLVEDVQPGTSYDSDVNKKKEKDLDGWSLGTLMRVNNVEYESTTIKNLDIKETIYLDALSSFMTPSNDKEVFNMSSDNKMGIVSLNDSSQINSDDLTRLPYVQLYRDLGNPYADFLTSRYFKQQLNPTIFGSSTTSSVSLYGGDSYMTPLKYTNTFFIDVHPRKRKTKKGFFKIILGAVLAIAAVAASILLPGAGLAISAALLTTLTSTIAVAAVQFGLSMISSGLKQDKLSRAYNDLWDKGLSQTVVDYDVAMKFKYPNPQDDEIQWMSDVVQDLWFETSFNGSLRLDADLYGVTYIPALRNVTKDFADKYILSKLTVKDQNQAGGVLYKGFATAEFYELNKDYDVLNHGKYYYSIPYEYDCCSDCRESFPHRIAYSEVSFSEELTDNFKKFLPNNYKDLSGETGPINNMFIQNNRLYLHTSEALWMQPNSYQERVTNEIVSFIGTGSLLEASAQRLVDDNTGNSVGLYHKWGATLCKHGYFFPSVGQNRIYLFNGKFEDLSMKGIDTFSKTALTNIKDNPTNSEGYTSGYDPEKERLLLTKRTDTDSWTLSYSLKTGSWRSFHSYIPGKYITAPGKFYTWLNRDSTLWKHNVIGSYQRFYGKREDHILQYISVNSPISPKITIGLGVSTLSSKYDNTTFSFINKDDLSYSSVMAYNSKQNTGLLKLKYRNEKSKSFFAQSLNSHKRDEVRISRADKTWFINDLRDNVIDYTKPMFINTPTTVGLNIAVNSSIIDYNKRWDTLQSFKDKYLVVKYIFNNFEDYKLTTNFTTEDSEGSLR